MQTGMLPWRIESAVEGTLWPALPPAAGAAVLALLQQFEDTQWLGPQELGALQRRQLAALLDHAWETVPFYRERWGRRPKPEALAELPLLTRRDVQTRFEDLASRRVPPGHGPIAELRTSGSTGTPLRVRTTALANLYWRAFTLRDHRWHGRDLGAKLAVLRSGATRAHARNWGPATDGLVATGPLASLGLDTSVDEQLAWLEAEAPAYLLTYPTLAAELARLALERGVALPSLREVRTQSEPLNAAQRALVREAWGIPVTDVYSAVEVGYIALQCPRDERYHVQSERILVEVLDDAGRPCRPGEAGRVVLTDLHNFAMPLVRYDIGDYAEPGERCACGRGLPVLERIAGRVRNMLVTAEGRRYYPPLLAGRFVGVAPVLQCQFVQTAYDRVEARLVTARSLTHEEEETLRRLVLEKLPPGIRLEFAYVASIPRGAGGKYEDFVSEVAAA